MKYALKTTARKRISDILTPVSVYLRLRDHFPNSLLLESSDYHANDNSFSYICCNPIASIEVKNGNATTCYPDGKRETITIQGSAHLPVLLDQFASSFQAEAGDYKFVHNGLFGFTAYDGVKHFEDLDIHSKPGDLELPDLFYAVYHNVIAINHFNNEAYLFAHCYQQEDNLDQIEQILSMQRVAAFPFRKQGELESNMEDEDFRELVRICKKHCARGDVFQIVPSRRFSQAFKGDEFNVYRALRSINPSPYLFYFDYGSFKIFGSSPEAQLVVKDGQAEIHPIAGTFRRTGNDQQDALLAQELARDEKENSEHVMLVDLARNDLSRHGDQVVVDTYREVQFFSHVIHLVSKVTARITEGTMTTQIVADTFPAGTLSGAPKYKAMELLEQYEPVNRSFYGGAIGFMDFDGNYNHAIIIRSFVSKDHRLHFQAGAGIVSESDDQKELQEVYNKLAALQQALQQAEHI